VKKEVEEDNSSDSNSQLVIDEHFGSEDVIDSKVTLLF
jgi:hypothetical protein